MAFYEIRPDVLKQDQKQLRLRLFCDNRSDLFVWVNRQSGEIDCFQLSFQDMQLFGQPEVLVEWQQARSLKFGRVDEGKAWKKTSPLIHFRPNLPLAAIEIMMNEFELRSKNIDRQVRQFILQMLKEELTSKSR